MRAPCTTCRIGDVGGSPWIEHAVIKGLQANANILRFHDYSSRIRLTMQCIEWPRPTPHGGRKGHQKFRAQEPPESPDSSGSWPYIT